MGDYNFMLPVLIPFKTPVNVTYQIFSPSIEISETLIKYYS